MIKAIKQWWLKVFHGVGVVVFWHNTVDTYFSGEYTITSKKDKNGYVRIYNDKVGHRVVPYYYLEQKK